jgi:hypothetical protein
MRSVSHRQISRVPVKQGRPTLGRRDAIRALHARCGVYTKPSVVAQILDGVGWQKEQDLRKCRLLEPASGDGEFVIEAGRRLIASCRQHGAELGLTVLADRILAFELHPREVQRARRRVLAMLLENGVHHRTANAVAASWVRGGDFLLSELPPSGFTHVVGNPPYVRWSKIPSLFKSKYDRLLPSEMIKGDLFLPFLDRSLNHLQPNGRCGFLCSNRWRFMAFAEKFRDKWLPLLEITSEDGISANSAFVQNVDAYPSILVAKRRSSSQVLSKPATIHGTRTLQDLGCVIKVGPALGHSPAFVLEPNESEIEPQLLRPWLDASEVDEGEISWRGRRIIVMYDSDEKLIQLDRFPLLHTRLRRFETQLKQRSIVRNGAPWYRPIDRVCAAQWTSAKLLIPELAKVPRVAIDRSGAIPSHGVYAIFAADNDIEAVYNRLRSGGLARALEGLAPKVKGGYYRCYRRFLEKIYV